MVTDYLKFNKWLLIKFRPLVCFYVYQPIRSKLVILIIVNNQLDAQLFMYVYFHSLHVSGNHWPIITRITVSVLHLVYVSLCR